MKRFAELAKLMLMVWGMAAAVVAVVSLFSPEKTDMRLMRVALLDVSLVTVLAQILFASRIWSAGLWTRRIVISVSAALIGTAVLVLSGLRPLTWTLCAIIFGGCVGVSSLVYLLADRIEARTLRRINERLGQND